MNHREIAGLMAAIAPTIGDFVGKAMAPLRAENERLSSSLAAVEQRFADLSAARDSDRVVFIDLVKEQIAKIELPKDGKDADPDEIKAAVLDVVAEILPGEVASAVEKIGKPKDGVDGKDADPVDYAIVAKLLVDLMPVPKDGKDGVDGKSVTLDEVAPLIEGAIALEFAKVVIPEGAPGQPGEAGKSITVEDVRPLLEELVAAIPVGKDGADGIAGKDGADGKEGAAGRDGRDGLPGVQGEKGIDGRHGVDGKDGFGIEDFDFKSLDDGRTLELTLIREGRDPIVKIVQTATVLERGVWREQPYVKGDGVTWGGQFYTAQRSTTPEDKPGNSDGWRLTVKKGRDGASAYDVACKAGFKGSEREWLDSLRPKPAAPVKGA